MWRRRDTSGSETSTTGNSSSEHNNENDGSGDNGEEGPQKRRNTASKPERSHEVLIRQVSILYCFAHNPHI
jgi:hypothetical protein